MKKLLEPDSQTKGLPGLYFVRSYLGLTQQQLAELANLSTVAIRHCETGLRDCSLAFVRRLAAAMCCNPADLLQEPSELRLAQINVAFKFRQADEAAQAVGG